VIRLAQALLVVAAAAIWGASRLPWVSVRSFDGLSPERDSVLDGAAWSTALLPIAVLFLAAALAALAVRGWALRMVAILVATGCLALGYLGVSLMVMPDVGPRGAELAGVPIASLVASQRHLTGAIVTAVAALIALLAAVLLMRSAVITAHPSARPGEPEGLRQTERGMWDALDEGRDPTVQDAAPESAEPDTEGR